MKAVVAVGFHDPCMAGAHLFQRLGFQNPEAVLVHTVEPVLPDGGFLPDTSTSPIVEIQRQRKADGERRMAEIADELEAHGVTCTSFTRYGNPAQEVTEQAREDHADLIVSGSLRKGRLETFMMGSVTRALVVQAESSILVAKTEVEERPKLNAVLATDHSDYANKWVDYLVSLAPMGLGTVTVVSADTNSEEVADALKNENPDGLGPIEVLERKNEATCKKLGAICDKTVSVVLRGKANNVIDAAMEETKADLLIVGAHGHGFIERLLMGSTAMYMVATSPWNVLVLRP